MFTLHAPFMRACCGLLRVMCLLSIGWTLMALPDVAQPVDTAQAQPPAPPPSSQIEIQDEPKTIDPVTLLPASLAHKVTAEFRETSLSDVVQWLRQQQQIGVLIDARALDEEGVLLSDPVTDFLDKEPLYLFFNRLQTLGLGWYFSDGNVHLTSLQAAEERLSTQHYNLGELLDAGFDAEVLTNVITTAVAPHTWEQAGGSASFILLADVLFVRQSDRIQTEVAGLLAALKDHGRRTFTFDAPQNELIRQHLEEKTVRVDFRNVPLVDAIAELAKQAECKIRIDTHSLQGSRVRERTPVTLELSDQKLRTTLLALLRDLDLGWTIRDGVLWVALSQDADEHLKTAVYDVRDLARDDEESAALGDAIVNQTAPQGWEIAGGIGTMTFAKPGVLVIHQSEENHHAILQLLENYRLALRSSKPRQQTKLDPTEVLTRYYRMPTAVADDLRTHLPELLSPESWRGPEHPEAVGTILQLSSQPEWLAASHRTGNVGDSTTSGTAVLVEYSVLVIRQTRQIHDQIPEIILRVQQGDGHWTGVGSASGDMGGMGGMGMGGTGGGSSGGFGGGFF